MMQQKIRKPIGRRWTTTWLIISAVSLYALVLRFLWHTPYLEYAILGPLIAVAWHYIDLWAKKKILKKP